MSLTVHSAPKQVAKNRVFSIKLQTDERPARGRVLYVERITVMEDPDENEFDIPLHGETSVTVNEQGFAEFSVWFESPSSLVEGRRWPIPFDLVSNGKITADTTAYIDCVEI